MTVTLKFSNMNNAEGFVDLKSDPISFSLAGDNVLVTGVAKKSILAYRILFVVDTSMNVTFKDGTGTSLSGAIPLLANGSVVLDVTNVPWYQTSPGNDLILTTSASGQVSGTIYYQVN